MGEEGAQVDTDIEEVRLVIALNGGVSLAVWMGGVAVELDGARRAHASSPQPADANRSGALYATLCAAFRRELVIDIMSGASAGGINGALLGAAIVHGQSLTAAFVRDKWLDLGDFSTLLQDRDAAQPESLMKGDLFADGLSGAFAELLEETDQTPHRAVDVKLDVTTTDVAGEHHAFRDAWRRSLTAREHRARFRFRRADDWSAATLAAAARASASFPFAFEPVEVAGEAQRIAGLTSPRWAIDGGLLDNAPIAAALALVPTRSASREVERYVLYVNADPPPEADTAKAEATTEPRTDGDDQHRAPGLRQLPLAVFMLPRHAPFVDQLSAIERALRPAQLGDDAPPLKLLQLSDAELDAIAGGLLPTYNRRRLVQSLHELIGDGAVVDDVYARYADATTEIPWLPDRLDVDLDHPWQWGLRPAQRLLHLLLDVLRRALRNATADASRRRLLEARSAIDDALRVIYDEQERIGARLAAHQAEQRGGQAGAPNAARPPLQPARVIAQAIELLRGWDPRAALRQAASSVHAVGPLLGTLGERAVPELLFGTAPAGADPAAAMTDAEFVTLLRRALAIEVVRRSLDSGEEEVETTQRMRFAQLTPFAPTPILDAQPVCGAADRGPMTKLTGLGLGHFAAFYRGSWRLNDFMWGRLDAAVRIADMLVSQERAARLGSRTVAAALASGLLPGDATAEQRWLVDEALAERRGVEPPLAAPPSAELAQLRARLCVAIDDDLADPEGTAAFTRTVCARAAQLEVLREELPLLVRASSGDAARGAGAPPLCLPLGDDMTPAIASLRGEPSLPERLRSRDEASSRLAVGTISHAALVALAMLRTARAPLANSLGVLRTLLTSLSHGVALRQLRWLATWARGTAVVVYAAAAALLASALMTTDERRPPDLGVLSAASVLSIASALVIVVLTAVVAGRFGRVARRRSKRRQRLQLVLLLACGGLAAFVLAILPGPLSTSRAIVGAGAERPPQWLLIVVLATVVLVAALVVVPLLLRWRIDGFLRSRVAGPAVLAFVIAVAAAVLVWAGVIVIDSIVDDGGWWRWCAGLLTLAAAPLCALCLFDVRGYALTPRPAAAARSRARFDA